MNKFEIPFDGSVRRTFTSVDCLSEATNDFISSHPTTSIVNDFIPYHALMSGKLLSTDINKTLLYNFDVNLALRNINANSYTAFFNALQYSAEWVKLMKRNINLDYRCRLGQLVWVVEKKVATPLATLVMNKEYLYNINKANPDYSKFFIVVNTSFHKSELHYNLYKSFYKYYLEDASQVIDVIYTKDILNFCYKHPNITPFSSKTIAESKTLYQQLTGNVLRAMRNNSI